MVAEINDQQSSHSAKTRARTHASSGRSAEEAVPMYTACKIEMATTLEMLISRHFAASLKSDSPESECECCDHLHLQVERKLQGPDNHQRYAYQYKICCRVEGCNCGPLPILSIVSWERNFRP